MSDSNLRAAFLLFYEEPFGTTPIDAMGAGTQTMTFVDSEDPDDDERFGPVSGTKTLTDTREEDDQDPATDSYAAIPRRQSTQSRAVHAGTKTKADSGAGDGLDEDEYNGTFDSLPLSGTQTATRISGEDTDADVAAHGFLVAGTGTATKVVEEQDSDEGAPSYAALPVPALAHR